MYRCALTLTVLFVACGFATIPTTSDGPRKLVCRFDLQHRFSPENPNVHQYRTNLCTHAVFDLGIVDQELGIFHASDDLNHWATDILHDIGERKDILKFITMDPWTNRLDANQVQVINTEIGRSRLVKSAIKLLKTNSSFQGVEVYLRQMEFMPWYWNSTTKLLSEMLMEFKKEGFLVSVLLPHIWEEKKQDFSQFADLEYLSIRAFPIPEERYYTQMTTFLSPLYSETGFSVEASIEYYVAMGIPKEKTVLGIPTIVDVYRLEDPDNHSLSSPTSGLGHIGAGSYSFLDQSLYNLHKCFQERDQWIFQRDELSGAPFASNFYNWVTYEDESSIRKKAEYVKEQGLGGAMIWTLDRDIFDEGFPVASLLNEILIGNSTANNFTIY